MHKFIVIEGLDGVGKSGITVALANKLSNLGRPARAIKSPIGDFSLSMPYVNKECDVNSHYLFYLAGVKHTSDQVRTMLRDTTVVCDRYIYTTEAYHKANGASVVVDLSTLQLLEPDYKFLIKVSDEKIRSRRIEDRGGVDDGHNIVKAPGNLIDRIEREFGRYNLIEIDNGNRPIDETVAEIAGIVNR
jgi:dTMP kinase